jgi:hypothetical protein
MAVMNANLMEGVQAREQPNALIGLKVLLAHVALGVLFIGARGRSVCDDGERGDQSGVQACIDLAHLFL